MHKTRSNYFMKKTISSVFPEGFETQHLIYFANENKKAWTLIR